MASVINTYARAFAEAVMAGKLDPEKTVQEARSLVALLADSRELREVWESPAITPDQKRKVLDAIVAREGISKTVRNFVAVVIDHQRMHEFTAIVAQFERELDDKLGFVEAHITGSRELDDKEKQTLELQVAALTGKKVRARYSSDAKILGGAIVRIGSTIYDGSVEGQLERIQEQLAGR